MSFDLYINFPQPTFPVAEWHELLAGFASAHCQVEFEDPPSEYAESGAKTCYLNADGSLVTVGVSRRIGLDRPTHCVEQARAAQWRSGAFRTRRIATLLTIAC